MKMAKIERIILKNLLSSEQFTRETLAFLTAELFQDKAERTLFEEIHSYILKYNQNPTIEAISVNLSNKTNINENDLKEAIEVLDEVANDKEVSDPEWLFQEAEAFAQERSLHNAVLESIHIMDGKVKGKDKGMIPKLLSDALAVSFDPNIGHDYLEDDEARYEYYHHIEKKIPFDLKYFNLISRNGLSPKTLTILLAGVNAGKTMFMCHYAAACLSLNYNVAYLTLEMAEERIAERIDANLLDIKLSALESLSKDEYLRKTRKLKENIKGKLIIKEYPPASANALHFKALLNELLLKKRFKPDVVIVDYINLCASSRIKMGQGINSYTYIKTIAEELRGLAVEHNIPILSATQVNRAGYTSTDPGMEDTSESFGLPATCDLMFAMIRTEDLDKMNQVAIKQLKNRYEDVTLNKRFVIGVDRAKMKFYDVEEQEQRGIQDSGQVPAESNAMGFDGVFDPDRVDYDDVQSINRKFRQREDIKV